MHNKNIAEILKNAPKGVLLYSPVFGYVNLVGVTDKVGARDKIIANIQFGKSGNVEFDSFGRYSVDGECMLFPSKFHKTWDDWQDSLFRCGDFITNIDGYKETFVIFKDSGSDTCEAYDANGSNAIISRIEYRWATEEEKNGFLAELDRNGLIWNSSTNEMEIKPKPEPEQKPEFKPGDIEKDISRIDKKPYFLKYGRYYICSEDFYVNSEHQDSLFQCGEICHSDEDNTVKNHNGCMFIDGHDGNAEVYFQEIDISNKELTKVKQYAYERWHKLWQMIPDTDKPGITKNDLNNLGRFMEIEKLNEFLDKL